MHMSMSSMAQSLWFYVAVLGVLTALTVMPLVAVRIMANHERSADTTDPHLGERRPAREPKAIEQS